MALTKTDSGEKYLKGNCPIKAVSKSITGQNQAIKLNWQNEIDFLKCLLKQLSPYAKWRKSKSLSTDVETEAVNRYIDYLIKNLNKCCNFSQIFKCDFSYFKALSKLKLLYFDCGSLTKSTQDFLHQLTVNKVSIYKRYKIHFIGTEEVL